MDALPSEKNRFRYQQVFRKDACFGHDGHLAILLRLEKTSRRKEFFWCIASYLQPGEEGGAGGKAMIDDGLFEKHPVQRYMLYIIGQVTQGTFGFKSSGLMASSNQFDIRLQGKGGMPCLNYVLIQFSSEARSVKQFME